MLDSIRKGFVDYYDALPQSIPRTIALSAVFSFTVSVILSKKADGVLDLTRPFLNTVMAATACAIHASVTPLFKGLGVDNGNIFEELTKWTFVTVIASGIFNLALAPEAGFKQFIIYSPVALNCVHSMLRFLASQPDARYPVNSYYIYWGF